MIKEEITNVLDKGYVKLLSCYGDDLTIVERARTSTQTETDRENRRLSVRDCKLLSYLIKNKHTSPFEMVCATFEVKAPIMVARQWIRHRTGKTNESSARYCKLETEFYIPDKDRIMGLNPLNKQSSSTELPEEVKLSFLEDLKKQNEEFKNFYDKYADLGVANEIIRLPMPVNMYTKFVWCLDVRNLLHFLDLRLDSHAQYEIREFAKVVDSYIKLKFPVTHFYYRHHFSSGNLVNSDYIPYEGE